MLPEYVCELFARLQGFVIMLDVMKRSITAFHVNVKYNYSTCKRCRVRVILLFKPQGVSLVLVLDLPGFIM